MRKQRKKLVVDSFVQYLVYSVHVALILACFFFAWYAFGIVVTLFLAFWILVFTQLEEEEGDSS